jgi:hypothetical protein
MCGPILARMIDLKRPLQGVPGLLLMATLILFGATVGISVALAWSWLSMSAELANFLGGVVGAGLGSALAIGGAVYVQHRERRFQLRPLIYQFSDRLFALISTLGELRRDVRHLEHGGEMGIPANLPEDFYKELFEKRKNALRQTIAKYEEQRRDFPDTSMIATEVHQRVRSEMEQKFDVTGRVDIILREQPTISRRDIEFALTGIARAEKHIYELQSALVKAKHD